MTLPNLLVIGAQRSGTSTLHRHLGSHPDVFMSRIKEPKFFALDGGPPAFRGNYPSKSPMIADASAYEALFDGVADERVVGESSTWYLHGEGVPERIEKHLTDVRFVAVLRDPVARAFSNFLNNRRIGMEPIASFQKAIEAEPGRRQLGFGHPWYYLDKGMYRRHLSRFYERFGADRIHVMLHEGLVADPAGELRRLFDFLGVAADAPIDPSIRENAGRPSRGGLLLRRWAPWAWRRSQGFPRAFEARLRAQYEGDVLALESLLGRDLSAWRSGPEA